MQRYSDILEIPNFWKKKSKILEIFNVFLQNTSKIWEIMMN